MVGYLNDATATSEVIREGWLRTGDLASRDSDGYIYLKGRSRDVIIRGGENVYPVDVEAVLREHEAVADAAVVGVPDAIMTEVPVAFVVLSDGREVTVVELLDFAAERLARFKRPVAVWFVHELPRTSNGKVQRGQLAELAVGRIGSDVR
jgi:fatty-acyl-CoA synthase